MTPMTITLIVAIVVAITLYSVTLREVIKKGYSGKRIARLLLPLGLIFIIYLSFNLFKIEPADWAQIILTSGLVGITIFYAFSAARQATASVKMAEAMTRPYLLLRLDLADDEFLQWDTYEGKNPSNEFRVLIRNAGNGAAKNLHASLWSRKDVYPYTSRGSLAPNEEWKASISKLNVGVPREGEEVEGWLPELREFIKYDDPVVAVTYQDIYNRKWVSYLCLERHADIDAFVMDGEQNTVESKADD